MMREKDMETGITNKAGRKYLAAVRRRLTCAAAAKEGFLATLTPELHNFELERPDADYAAYTVQFGTPKTVAKAYLEELSDRDIMAYWKPIIAAGIAAFVLLIALMVLWIFTHRDSEIPRYSEEYGVPVPEQTAMLSARNV